MSIFGNLTLLQNMTSTVGLSCWFGIFVTYLRFRMSNSRSVKLMSGAGMEAQGIDRSTLPFKSKFSKAGAYYSLVSRSAGSTQAT